MAQEKNTGEQQIVANNGGIIDFLKKASEVKKSAFDEAKAKQLIEHFGGDPNRIVEAVGKTIGVKDLETFKKLSFEKYGLGGEQPAPQPAPEPSQTDQYLADKTYEGAKGYERGVQLQETIDRGQQLKSNLEQKLAPKEQPINLGNIPEPKSTVPTPIQIEQPYDYERDIQRSGIQEEISDVDRRVGQLRTDLSSTRKENRKLTGYPSAEAKAVAEEVKEHNLKLQEAISNLEKNATYITSAPGEVRGGIMVPKQEDSQKLRDLRDFQSILKKIQKEYEAPIKGEGRAESLWWGLTQSKTARDFATLGMNEMMRAHNVRQAFEKEQAGEQLTTEESKLLDVYKNFQQLAGQSDKSIWTQVGSTLQEMLPFMVQFAATSGIGASARTIASQYIKNQLTKTVANGVAGTAAQVATMPYTYQRYAERRAPVLGEDGNLTAGETPFEAGWKTIAEVASEIGGERWASIDQQKFRSFMVDKMSDPKVASTFLGKMATRLSQETGVPMVQSAPFELLGEYYTGIMQSAIDQDASFFDPEQQKVLLLSVGLAAGGASVASAPMKYSAKKSMQNAQAELDDLSNDDYRDAILGITENFTDPEEIMDQVIAAAKQMNASSTELLTGLKYAGKTIAYNQMNDASAINVQRKINEFKSNDGTLTSAVVDGKKVTVRNPENLGQPGKAVFVKNEDGTVKMVNSTDIKDFTVQNEQDVVSDIQAQEEAEMAELEAKDAAVAAAAQAGIEPNRTVKTPSGIAKVVDILPDNTIAVVDAKGNQSSYMIDEVEAYKTDEQKKAEAEAEKQQIEAEKQAAEQAEAEQQQQQAQLQQQAEAQAQQTAQPQEQIAETPQYPVLEDGAPDYDSMAPEQFYEVFSNEFGQEAAMAEITDMSASIDKKIQSLQKKRQNATSANQRATIAREIKSLTEQGDNLRGIIANINERTVTEADIAPAIETRPELQEMPEEDRNLWIAENSTDPNEIAEAFEREKQNSPAANLTEWQKATLGVRFTPESFRRHGDWNNMTRTMAKAWISNDGVGIDQFVKDNFEDVPGFEDVTPQDVVDFITANPNGSVRSTTDTQNMLRKRYATVTGKSINAHKFDIDTNDTQVKLDNFLRNSGVNMSELFSTEDVIEAVDNNRNKLSDNEYNEFIEFLDSEIRRQESEAIDWLESGQSNDAAFRRVSGNVIADPGVSYATETKTDATANQYPYLNISDKAKQDLANRPRLLSALGNLSNEIKRTANIINSSEIPANVQEQLAQKGTGYSTGFYANGQVYILSDMSPTVSEAVKTYIHEIVVHKGFRELFRNAEPQTVLGRSYQKFNDLLADVYGSMTTDQIQKLAKEYAANVSDINQLTTDQKYEIAEEFLAHMAELELTPTAFQEFIDRLLHIIKKTFKFTNAQFTRSDLLKMINERRAMMSQTPEVKTEGDIRFKRESESELYKLAKESATFEDFYDKYRDLNFRDAHSAPSTDDRPSSEKVEEGGDFSLIEVANGYHNQPSDYFAPRIGARYYGYDDMEGMQSYSAISSAIRAIKEGNADVKITAYRAIPKSIKSKKLMDYDWVTFSREYAVGHGEHRFGEGEYRIIKQEVSPEHLWWDGNDINEWGYDTDKTKKYYRNDLLSIWEQVKAQDNETRFRILGQTGASNLDNAYETNVRMDNLRIADEMEKAGESAKVIRLATGWERGADGQWRYETPDGNLSEDYRDAETLAEAWDDEGLFKAYPQLKDVRIGSIDVDMAEEAQGYYMPSQIDDMPTIHAIAPTREELRSVMVHEIQHAIQDIEGFTKGGIPEVAERTREEQILLSQYANGDMSASDFLAEAEDLIEENELYDVRNIIQNNTPEQVAALLEAENQGQEQKYKSYAGEVEARNVQSRIDMTPEQRANTLLSETEDVQRGMQIVSTDSKNSALKLPETIRLRIEQERSNVNTDPSQQQKESGNYKKGHVSFDGFDISIENPLGSTRSGTDRNGKKWSVEMPVDYGYFKGTTGADKDHIDVMIGEKPELDKVYVVDQIDQETGRFDEHKVMMGFDNISQARKMYNASFEKGWSGLGKITRTNKQDLKEWFKNGDMKKPFSGVEFEEKDVRFRLAYHGSPHQFEKFTTEKIGTGEGAQAFGWGLYFTDKKSIAEDYAKRLIPDDSRENEAINNIAADELKAFNGDKIKAIESLNEILKESWSDKKRVKKAIRILETGKPLKIAPKNLYAVELHQGKEPGEYDYLRWDKNITKEQVEKINKQAEKEGLNASGVASTNYRGEWAYKELQKKFRGLDGTQEAASKFLLRAGIDGIQYPTEITSKGSHEESFNYVIFDESAVEIKEHVRFRKVVVDPLQTQINWDDPQLAKRSEGITPAKEGYNPVIDNSVTIMERQLTNRGLLEFGGQPMRGPVRIQSANDVAFLFRNLENASSENSFVVFIGKDESYKVLYISTGTSVGVTVDLKSIPTAAKEFGAEKIVFVHNHPSGNLTASNADIQIHNQVTNAGKILGIEVLPSVIINLDSGQYSTIENGKNASTIFDKTDVDANIPVEIHQFDRQVLYAPSNTKQSITSAADVAMFLSKQKRGSVSKIQAMILDRRNAINKYLLIDGNLSVEELSAQLMAEVGRHGESVILASNGAISPADARAINRNLESISSTLLDVLQIKQDEDILSNYESFANNGLLEPEAKYEGEAKNNDIRFRKVSYIGFYSTVESALDQIKQEKGTPEQFKAMLLKNGAKQAEMDWMGFDDRFPDTKKSITKADIQNWIDQNRIEVEEVVKGNNNTASDRITIEEDSNGNYSVLIDGAIDDDNIQTRARAERIAEQMREQYEIPIDDTKYSKYQEPGGSNYKEVLLTMPVPTQLSKTEKEELSNLESIKAMDRTPKQNNRMQELYDKIPEANKNTFKSSHFDEPNILAHVRFNERKVNGEKVLFLEEIQSDWAQKGKKEGFKGDLSGWNEQLGKDAVAAIKDMDNLGFDSWQQAATEIERNPNYETDFDIDDQYKTLLSDWRKAVIAKRKEGNAVPTMPFTKTDQWVNLALRRMMRYAAENGFDRIAWTNGEMQANRYDLSKQIGEVRYFKSTNPKSGYDYDVVADDLQGRQVFSKELKESEIEDNLGKEIAKKIINDEGSPIKYGSDNPMNKIKEEGKGTLSGLDLAVGGEGMKAFYNAIIPSAASKLGKPFGAKPEQIKVNDQTVLSIPVTEKMKAETKNGMPLFRLSSENDAAQKILDAYYAAREVGRISDKIKGIEESIEEADREAMKELKKQLSTLKQAANLSEKDTRRQIQALQNGLVTYAKKHMPTDKAGKLEINSLLGTIKNTNKPEAIEKALEKIDEITSKVNRKIVRKKSEAKVNKLIQYATTNKKAGDMERGKFNIEDTREFAKLKRYNDEATMLGRITRSTKASEEQKDQARTRLDKMIDELSAESSLINSVAMKLVQWRAMGAKTSDALIESLKEDLEYLYETARDAKKEADIIYADKLEADKEFIKQGVRGTTYDKQKNIFKKLDISLNDFTANLMGNWETLLTMLGGLKARNKYSLIMPQVNEDMGVNEAFDGLLTKAMKAYGFDSKNKMLKTIQSLSKLDYELAQPIHKGKRIEGEPDKISKMHIIDIYNAIKNENIKESWEKSYGEEVINNLVSNLSEADKEFADAMMEIIDSYGERTNAVYVDMFNRDRPDVGVYWPSTAMVDTEIDVMQQYFEEGKIPSFFKERSSNRTPKPVDAFGKFTKHVKESEWLLNKAVMLNNLNKVFRDQSVKKLITQSRGQSFYNTVIAQLKKQGLRPSVADLTTFEEMGGAIVGNWAAAKIGASISVPLKQLISVVNYSEDMPVHEWALGFAKAMATPLSTKREMWNIPYVQNRFSAGYTEALQHAMNATSRVPKAKSFQQRIKDFETIGTRGGDILAVMFGGKPYYDYLIKKGYSQAEAEQKFIEATIRSQQSPYSSTLSIFQNSKNPLSKAVFMFANTPSQYMRKMFEASQAYRHGDLNAKQVAKIYTIYSVANAILFVGASAVVGMIMKGADPDDEFWENVAVQTIVSFFGGMPLINDIVESTSRQALGLHIYDDALPVIKELNDIRSNFLKVAKGDYSDYSDEEKRKEKRKEYLKRGSLSMLELAGLSATNAVKTFNMITRRSEVVSEQRSKEVDAELSSLSKKYRKKKTMYEAMPAAEKNMYTQEDDYKRELEAERLKRAYSKAKAKASELKAEGKDAEAEDLLMQIEHSKSYLKNTNFDIQDLIEETKYVNSISE